VNNKLKMIWKEMIVTLFFPESEENLRKLSVYLVSRLRFEPGTSRIHVASVTA
jgi:hypothetical protein